MALNGARVELDASSLYEVEETDGGIVIREGPVTVVLYGTGTELGDLAESIRRVAYSME